MRVLRLNGRMILLILAEAALVYGAMICAVYLRFGLTDGAFELLEKNGFLKAALAAFFCLAAFYLFDLYDFLLMHDRRELVLRLIQALGLAWIVLAFSFYTFPEPDAGSRCFVNCVANRAHVDGLLAHVDSLVTGPSGFR